MKLKEIISSLIRPVPSHRARHRAGEQRQVVERNWVPESYPLQFPQLWERRLEQYEKGIIVRNRWGVSPAEQVHAWIEAQRQRWVREQSKNWGWLALPFSEWSPLWSADG